MGGCCCRSARRTESLGPPVYYYCPEDFEENEALSSTHDPPSAVAVLPVDPAPDSSIPGSLQEPHPLLPLTQSNPPRAETIVKNDDCDGLKEPEHKSASDFSPKKLSDFEKSLILVTDDEDVCPTCLEEYDAENPRIITKCKHHFHLSCILEWFERSNTCAICDKIMEVDNMALFDQTL